MFPKIRVAIAGASGVTGSSIANALLGSPEKFEVNALARPASVDKKEYVDFAKRGMKVKPVELGGPLDAIVQALTGIDVVISCMTLIQFQEEMALVTASSEAGVHRYVPSFFGPCCPPRGVMKAREMKEDILDHIKRLYVPYTIIDVGWWYQLSLPPLPSGKLDIKIEYSATTIIGEGNTPWALTDNRDIGKFVARIITDPRTLDKMVFVYGQVWTQNEVWNAVERITSETLRHEYTSKAELLNIIAEGKREMADANLYSSAMLKLGMAQYRNLLGIRGDNTPEHAKYLGYLDARELYPDIEEIHLENYIRDLFEKRVKAPFS